MPVVLQYDLMWIEAAALAIPHGHDPCSVPSISVVSERVDTCFHQYVYVGLGLWEARGKGGIKVFWS